MYDLEQLNAVEERLRSGALEKDFSFGTPAKKEEILEFLQKLMDVADLADEAATRIIFKDTALAQFAGVNAQNDRSPEGEE